MKTIFASFLIFSSFLVLCNCADKERDMVHAAISLKYDSLLNEHAKIESQLKNLEITTDTMLASYREGRSMFSDSVLILEENLNKLYSKNDSLARVHSALLATTAQMKDDLEKKNISTEEAKLINADLLLKNVKVKSRLSAINMELEQIEKRFYIYTK